MSYIGENAKWNSGEFTPQSNDPSNPQEGEVFYSDGTPRSEGLWIYTNGAWRQVSNKGELGINYIADPDSEGPLGSDWITYADAASSIPVDGNGGVANITLTRETSAQLRGIGSFKITKDAADRQGEGVSTVFSIDNFDQDKVLSISFDYSTGSGYETGDLSVWVFDIDNSQILNVSQEEELRAGSHSFQGTWNATDSSNYRLIIHTSTTNATAYTVDFDNVVVGPQAPVFGPAMTDWADFTSTLTNFGNATQDLEWKRIGDSLIMKGRITIGSTLPTGELSISLPPGLTTSSTIGQSVGPVSADEGGLLHKGSAVVSSTTEIKFMGDDGTGFWNASTPFTWGISNTIDIENIIIPIDTWSVNTVSSESRTINMSQILEVGTRVTSAPTKLGEYRSRSKTTSSSNNFADAAPSTSITGADGFKIDAANYASAQSSGLISLWNIFVGKHKNVAMRWFSTTGKTGTVFTDFAHESSTNSNGVKWTYDPSAGIVTVEAGINLTSNTSRGIGVDTSGNSVTSGYFDIIVSDQTIAVQSDTIIKTATVYDQKPSGTQGGSFTAGAWQKRDLNTISDPFNIGVTLSSSQFTLKKGRYKVDWSAPAFRVDTHKSRLYNVTDSAEVAVGGPLANTATVTIEGYSQGTAVFEIFEDKTYRIEHSCQSSRPTDGFGGSSVLGADTVNVYTRVVITKLN